MTARTIIAGWVRDYKIARLLEKRCHKRRTKFVHRKADGAMFAASSPQNFGYAMRGLFSGKAQFHLARVREWQGLLIVSRKVFWIPNSTRDFTLDRSALRSDLEIDAFWLPAWPEDVECAKIDAKVTV